MEELTREHAAVLDAADPLAHWRQRFFFGSSDEIYLDGNSLGRLPMTARERMHQVIDEWGTELVRGWQEWWEYPSRTGAMLAPLLGANSNEVTVCDSTTVNLFKLCEAVVDAHRLSSSRALATDAANFPSDRFVLEGLAARHGLQLELFEADPVLGPQPQDIERVCKDGTVSLITLSHVSYRSGAMADMAAINQVARRQDVTVVWDVAHAAGAVPIDFKRDGTELAVGCTYKYLNGGPGAPAFLYVAEELQDQLSTPIWGWFAQEEPFNFERPFTPIEGAQKFMTGCPGSMVAMAAVQESAAMIREVGIEALRAKSIAQCELMIALYDLWLKDAGFALATPRNAAQRGSHISFSHEDAWQICCGLIQRAGVVPDFRGPDIIRFASTPLYTRFVDIWDAMERLSNLMVSGEYKLADARRSVVT